MNRSTTLANVPTITLKQRVYRGVKEYLAIAFYLWLVFGLFVLYKSVILAEHNIPFAVQGLALFNALALAKVMLVAKELHFAEGFKKAPLIYPAIFKSVCFAIVLGCFKLLEDIVVGLYHGRSFHESLTEVGGGSLRGTLSMVVLLAVILIPFFAFTELGEVLGEEKLRTLFFKSRDLRQGGPSRPVNGRD